ncbi:MAG: hypothetical protein OXC81_05675, partial [Betaproteobacteria bacterium]|nr:hypothetical protein [Betaproteobacteria bacterium]
MTEAIQINPGGRLDIKDVIGRDREIKRYWGILQRQGLVISAERRIGKTHIVLKMQQECGADWLVIYQDLEDVHSLAGLVRSIREAFIKHSGGSSFKEKANWLTSFLPESIGSIDLGTVGQDACFALLDKTCASLIEKAGGRKVLLLWDEFPLMLENIRRRETEDVVLRLLDSLRALRSTHASSLRFLFTGSIGLHLVLRNLHRSGGTNDSVNDMFSLTVPPLTPESTCQLAAGLLRNTQAAAGQIPGLAKLIAEEVGGFPYHVHHVIDQLAQLPRPPQDTDIARAIDDIISAPADPVHMSHNNERLFSYYSDQERQLARIMLNALAGQQQPVSRENLLNLCRHCDTELGDDRFGEILSILQKDHYIESLQSQ